MDSQMHFAVMLGIAAAVVFAVKQLPDSGGKGSKRGAHQSSESSFGTKVACALGVGLMFFLFILRVPSLLHGAFMSVFPQMQQHQSSK